MDLAKYKFAGYFPGIAQNMGEVLRVDVEVVFTNKC